jgi:RNA ligase
MTTLADVFDVAVLDEMLAAGHVRATAHPELDLVIYNYTETAQYGRVWNDVTRACRGLIVDGGGHVVARPFAKFFNFGEHDADSGHGPVVVTDKMDGSLGILYQAGGRHRIATRGSFTSDQALHATALLETRYSHFTPERSWTYLFEIVFPQNRIVVDYGDLDDLVLLGAIDIATGRSVPLDEAAASWPGPRVEVFDFANVVDAVTAGPRPNREGFVVHFVEPDVRVKVKYDEYVRLHRIVTGLSTKVIFEHLRDGRPLVELIDGVPDELFDTVRAVADDLQAQRDELVDEIGRHYAAVCAAADPRVDRKAFAQAVLALEFDCKHALFTLADRGAVDDTKVWEHIRPPFRRLGAFGGDAT